MRYVLFTFIIFSAAAAGNAQSTIQEFPTPIVSNSISGSINARPIGDARQTSHYYVFHGEQGDVFINVVTRNLAGTIEVFNLEGLRPMTRIVLFADSELSETGRVIYLRKPEKMLLRVQGRTPNDDPADYTIKFAGSFAAISDPSQYAQVEPPSVTALEEIRNAEEREADRRETERTDDADRAAAEIDRTAEEPETPEPVKTEDVPEMARPSRVEVVVTEPELPKADDPRPAEAERVEAAETERVQPQRDAAVEPTEPAVAETQPAEKEPGQFNLVIQFRNGAKIERPMSQVLRFTIDRGTLTVIDTDGRIGRYSMREVLRVGID